jgi:hypothetical protein
VRLKHEIVPGIAAQCSQFVCVTTTHFLPTVEAAASAAAPFLGGGLINATRRLRQVKKQNPSTTTNFLNTRNFRNYALFTIDSVFHVVNNL